MITTRLAIALLGLAAVLGACTAPSGAQPSASPTASAAADCITIEIPKEGDGPQLAQQVERSDLIVVATFKGFGADRWNTPDGLRPPQAKAARDLATARIFRPVKAKVIEALKGDSQRMVKALVGGGTIGCDTVAYGNEPELVEGVSYVMFFRPIINSAGEVKGDLMLGKALPIAADGTVTPDYLEPIKVSDLAAMISDGTVPSPTPEAPFIEEESEVPPESIEP